MRKTINDITRQKAAVPIVVLTAYTAPMARLLDPYVDILLVGDSLGMVLYGMENTQGVTLEMMMRHGKAVAAHSTQALVVIDMPAGSYEDSKEQALDSARSLMEMGAQAVKLEGGVDMAEAIAHLVQNGVPVMAHVGLLPQRVKDKSGFKYQGRTPDDAARIMADALAVQEAGAFSVVIEAVAESLAAEITAKLAIPTIGIGASNACDGQVLVSDDMLGLTASGYVPSFVKPYAKLSEQVIEAVESYAQEVRARIFPGAEHVFRKKIN